MYSRILVAVDGSDTSRHALKQAIELARKLSAQLRIIHVVDMSWLPIGSELAIDTHAISAARCGAGEKKSRQLAKQPRMRDSKSA